MHHGSSKSSTGLRSAYYAHVRTQVLSPSMTYSIPQALLDMALEALGYCEQYSGSQVLNYQWTEASPSSQVLYSI